MSIEEKDEKESPYKDCVFFQEKNCPCGPFKRWEKDGMFTVNEFGEDISKHLQTLKVNNSF